MDVRSLHRFAAVAATIALNLSVAVPAAAQSTPVSGVPPAVAAQIQALGPVIDAPGVRAIYAPLAPAQPGAGVATTTDIAFGADEKQRLDVYRPQSGGTTPLPVLVFVHGGAFVGGDKAQSANVGYAFARRGVVVIVTNYRLAPAHPFPAGAEDVAAAVAWTRANAAQYGGDPARIVLMGHSAGASHTAAFALTRRFQPRGGSGLAGLILVSGAGYDPGLEYDAQASFGGPDALKPDLAYFGPDTSRYADAATLRHLDAPALPVMLTQAELDPLMMQVATPALLTALCRRDNHCPRMTWLRYHDHLSPVYALNTGDESLLAPALDFIRVPR